MTDADDGPADDVALRRHRHPTARPCARLVHDSPSPRHVEPGHGRRGPPRHGGARAGRPRDPQGRPRHVRPGARQAGLRAGPRASTPVPARRCRAPTPCTSSPSTRPGPGDDAEHPPGHLRAYSRPWQRQDQQRLCPGRGPAGGEGRRRPRRRGDPVRYRHRVHRPVRHGRRDGRGHRRHPGEDGGLQLRRLLRQGAPPPHRRRGPGLLPRPPQHPQRRLRPHPPPGRADPGRADQAPRRGPLAGQHPQVAGGPAAAHGPRRRRHPRPLPPGTHGPGRGPCQRGQRHHAGGAGRRG